MNRLSSLIAAGLTTGLSAAAVGATAVGQGIFGGGSPEPEAPATGETVTAIETAVAQQPTAVPDAVATQVIYVDKEPIVVTRQVTVFDGRSGGAQTDSGDTATPAEAGAQAPQTPPVDTLATTPPAPTPQPAEAPPPQPAPASPPVALPASEPPPTAAVATGSGGTTHHDGRGEPGDDRPSGEDDDHEDDDDRDHDDDQDEGRGGDDD
ncbi:MAG TPA: hypothetical protein PL082_01100 [Tepidiformaceae bacterium]|nr:hypothetical protein [Tepidiformaceae bacterium]